jgi:hypothetical protein
VLGLPIGWGLLRLNRGWRGIALVFLGISLIGIPIVMLFALTSAGTATINIFGLAAGTVDKTLFLMVAVVGLAMTAWQYRVLTRPDVRDLFELQTPD